MRNEELAKKFYVSQDFLNHHPGISKGLMDNTVKEFNCWADDVCVNNKSKRDYREKPENVTVHFHRGSEGFVKYFESRIKDEDGEDDTKLEDDREFAEFDTIEVPYRVVYGCEWAYDRTVWNGEYSIHKFIGDPKKKVKPQQEYKYWNSYEGTHIFNMDSYEELIIALAEDVKKNLGDFGYESFLTDEEKANHEKERLFFFVPTKEGNAFEMKHNRRHIDVSEEEKNLRWWKWFRTTEYYKAHWDGE